MKKIKIYKKDLEDLKNIINEQYGMLGLESPEIQLEIALALCKSYCRMMGESFDKAIRSPDKDNIKLQFQIVQRHLEALDEEMKNSEKFLKNLK